MNINPLKGTAVAAALVAGALTIGAGAANASVPDDNQPSTWEKYLGDGSTCAKVFDGPGSPAFYTLGAAPNGYTWTLIVVNAGKPGEGRSTVTPNPAPGNYTNSQTGDVSNVIVCKKATGEQKPTEVSASVDYTEPTCDAPGEVSPSQGDGYTWSDDGVYWAATAKEGYVLVGQTKFGPYPVAQLTGQICEEDTPTPTPTPTPVPSVPGEEPEVPEAPEAPAPPAPEAAPQSLPTTGSENWIMAALAAALIAAGGGATWLSRRPRSI